MSVRFPAPLQPGDRVAVTSPSSGVPDRLRPRLQFALETLSERGLDVVVGECMDGEAIVSAPAQQRAEELTAFLTDPDVRAVIPPWGGETAIDLVPLLDWERLAQADPTWFVGFSDISTLLTPLTLLSGIATLHGNNLMDSPYAVPPPLLHWVDVVTQPRGAAFTQGSPGRHRAGSWDDWIVDPRVTEHTFNGYGGWSALTPLGEGIDVEGRLVGGCIETLCNLAGTRYLDTTAFAAEHAPEGLLVYVEAAGDDAATICRNLHGMRLAGFFDAANAVLIGRTAAADLPTLTQKEAVLDALGCLGVPIVADVECGHVPPYLPIVNGAAGRLQLGPAGGSLRQTLA
jgi:muramoyltetrapeptide carboxypeptidase LdcA involved in peptidoglycan recycling